MEEKTMLVLSRKENQAIHIGDNIKLTVLRVRGKTIRIGFEAPEDVRILWG
jgi:carbon storage regulator